MRARLAYLEHRGPVDPGVQLPKKCLCQKGAVRPATVLDIGTTESLQTFSTPR
jgi:hypothetical protein